MMFAMTLPDRDQAHAWAQLLRQSGAVRSLPAHLPYRMAALADAADARYVDVHFPDESGPVDARILVLTEDLIIECRSHQIDLRQRTGSGQATTVVTIRPLSDVTQLALAGDDIDWAPGQFGELEPTLGSFIATLADGAVLELPLTRAARSKLPVAIELLRRGLRRSSADTHGRAD
jgi:hypothetical protein